MADIKTRGDAVRVYLTGAVDDGDEQADESLSLGNARSSVELRTYGLRLINPMRGVFVEFASGANGVGTGRIEAYGSGSLRWIAPGGTLGAAVAIANGETKVLEDGTVPGKFVRVRRTTADDLAGSMNVRMTRLYHNAVSGKPIDDATRQAGLVFYRCLAFYNESAASVTNFKAWVDASTSGLAIGSQGRVNGAFADISVPGETAAPAGVVFDSGTTAETGLQIGTVAAGADFGLWLKMTVDAGASASPALLRAIHWSYDIA